MSFGSPYLLFVLLLVPGAIAVALWFDRRRARYAVAFTNLDVLATVADGRQGWRRWVPLTLFLLALAGASVALARPMASTSKPAQRATIVLLVDVSGSMRTADIKPTRLGAAQAAMETFVERVPKSVKVGLVSFSSAPDVLVVPTTDRGLLREAIDFLEPEAATAIGDGLAVAVRVTKAATMGAARNERGELPAAIILLSDGAQTLGKLTPLQGAGLAARAGVRVYTVVLGTNHGSLGLDPFGGNGFGGVGQQRFLRPDPVTLAAVARATGGQTYRAQSATRAAAVYRHLGSSIARRRSTREISSWFSGIAALLLVASLAAGRIADAPLP